MGMISTLGELGSGLCYGEGLSPVLSYFLATFNIVIRGLTVSAFEA
jgi:hypothetical protein